MRIIILMIYAALGYAVYVFVRGYFSSMGTGSEAGSEAGSGRVPKTGGENSKMVECSECGTMIPLSHSKTISKSGEVLYFCSDECLEKQG